MESLKEKRGRGGGVCGNGNVKLVYVYMHKERKECPNKKGRVVFVTMSEGKHRRNEIVLSTAKKKVFQNIKEKSKFIKK